MKTIATFRTLEEADAARTLIENAGISVFVADQALFTAGYGPVTGGVHLQVSDEYELRAKQALLARGAIVLPEEFDGIPEPSEIPPLPSSIQSERDRQLAKLRTLLWTVGISILLVLIILSFVFKYP